MRTYIILVAVIFSTSAMAKAPEGYASKWLCRADRAVHCEEEKCSSRSASVTMEFDFEAMTAQNFSVETPDRLTHVKASAYSATLRFGSDEGQMWTIDNPQDLLGTQIWGFQMATLSGEKKMSYYLGECRAR